MNVAKRVGANIVAHRERIGISQEELAWRAGLHRTAIGLLERGERVPRVDTLVKLAGSLGVGDRTPFIGPPRVRVRGWSVLSIAPDRRLA